jgi:hypothetical protein
MVVVLLRTKPGSIQTPKRRNTYRKIRAILPCRIKFDFLASVS